MDATSTSYLYLYDLPKEKISSVKIALAFKAHGINIGTKKPLIKRDMLKPFYSAIIHFQDPQMFQLSKEKMKYFDIDGYEVRALPYEKDQRDKKLKEQNLNVFFKLPKDGDKSILTYKWVQEKFEKYGEIKKCKIAMNADGKPKGFAYICFQDEESVKKCLADKHAEGVASLFEQSEQPLSPDQMCNQVYFKNVALGTAEADVKKWFEPYGEVKSFIMQKSDKGHFGFVQYGDKSGKNKMAGPEAVNKAIEGLTDKDLGATKLHVSKYLSKEQREKERMMTNISFRSSKKRCNLYVTNFPPAWPEEELRKLFSTYGEIESVKHENSSGANFAFVCFSKPESASVAKQALHGTNLDGQVLQVSHYEIKEIRDLQKEEEQDKKDWDNYVAQQFGGNIGGVDLMSQPMMSQLIQQLLQMNMNQNQPQQQQRYQGGNRPQYQNKGPKPQFQQNQGPPRHQPQPQQPMPSAPTGAPHDNKARYAETANKLIPSVQERNPYVKEQVGQTIYDYVQMICGPEKAPKVTGMLIQLPLDQIKQYLGSFDFLQMRVFEAVKLIDEATEGQ